MRSWIVRLGFLVMILLHGSSFSSAAELQGAASAPEEPLSLWYRRPATVWTEALPLGNGRLGAMVFGGIDSERLQLNEGTLWAAGPYDPANLQAPGALAEVRRLIFEGKLAEANRIVGRRMMARPLGQMPYQTLGDLLLQFPPATSVKDYRRDLDLDTAIATTSYASRWDPLHPRGFRKRARPGDRHPADRQCAGEDFLDRPPEDAPESGSGDHRWPHSVARRTQWRFPGYSRETHVRCRREDPQRGRYQDRRA